jgi:glycine C-acetyltransferase
VSHDLGVLGETGRGVVEMQKMLGRIDVVVGSFSKVFAANGGFVASSHPALKAALRLSCSTLGESNAISPVQAAIVLAALEIVASEDGRERRESLIANARHLRERLVKAGFELRGEPGPVVTVRLGPISRARRLTAEVLANGALVNLTERIGANHATPDAVWRLRVMAGHGSEEIDGFVDLLIECRKRLAAADEKAFSDRFVAA